MENAEEFESWLFRLLADAKIKLGMSDKLIAYILLREGLNYYLREVVEDDVSHKPL
uniref:Uncharacterized protein n=1 Tax=viral metagenome TaxID=1070528 RepID=A0A6M3IXQ0_9ZZZZ